MIDRITRFLLIALTFFLSVTALYGGIFVVPSLPVTLLEGSMFSSYFIPAVALAVVVGGSALIAATALALGREWGSLAAVCAGVGVALFEIVEVLTTSLDVWLQAFGFSAGARASGLAADAAQLGLALQAFYFVVGVVIAAFGARMWMRSTGRALRLSGARRVHI